MILRYGAYVNVATARARVGGRIDVRRPATPLLVHNGRVTGAETPRGTVETATLVQSAGAWTNTLLRRLDRRVPQAPLPLPVTKASIRMRNARIAASRRAACSVAVAQPEDVQAKAVRAERCA